MLVLTPGWFLVHRGTGVGVGSAMVSVVVSGGDAVADISWGVISEGLVPSFRVLDCAGSLSVALVVAVAWVAASAFSSGGVGIAADSAVSATIGAAGCCLSSFSGSCSGLVWIADGRS